jgi:hypothetical protein
VACIEIERLAHASYRTTIWHTRLVILVWQNTLWAVLRFRQERKRSRYYYMIVSFRDRARVQAILRSRPLYVNISFIMGKICLLAIFNEGDSLVPHAAGDPASTNPHESGRPCPSRFLRRVGSILRAHLVHWLRHTASTYHTSVRARVCLCRQPHHFKTCHSERSRPARAAQPKNPDTALCNHAASGRSL